MKIRRKSGDSGSWLAGRGTCILFDTKRGETPDCWKREGCSCCQWKRRRLSSQRLGRQHNQEAPYCDLALAHLLLFNYLFVFQRFIVCSSTCLACLRLFPGHRRGELQIARGTCREAGHWVVSQAASSVGLARKTEPQHLWHVWMVGWWYREHSHDGSKWSSSCTPGAVHEAHWCSGWRRCRASYWSRRRGTDWTGWWHWARDRYGSKGWKSGMCHMVVVLFQWHVSTQFRCVFNSRCWLLRDFSKLKHIETFWNCIPNLASLCYEV